MRWKQPNYGETQVVEKFLFLPMTFNNETRWWENARIVQRYVEILREGYGISGRNGWVSIAWADDEQGFSRIKATPRQGY